MVTEKSSGNVEGTATSAVGYYAVKWWDNTTTVYASGATFSKAAAGGSRAFELYPCRASGAAAGQFDGFNISNNGITQLRAQGVSLAAAVASRTVPGTVQYSTSSGGFYTPPVTIPGSPVESGILSGNLLSAAALDQFYTDLAAGGGDIFVSGNPGTASDSPTIATAKGYTVFGSVYVAPGTALLLNFNGTNGSTTFTDSSGRGVSVTANGGVQISTAQSKFGGSSVFFDGSNDYLRVSLPFDYSGDFTVEFWFRRSGSGGGSNPTFFEAGDIQGGQGGVHLSHDTIARVTVSNGITGGHEGGSLPLNTWVHVALVRYGGTNKIYVGGTSVGSDTLNYAATVTNNIISIGSAPNYGFWLNGYMDDFRAVTGYAVYTANFTPPTAQLGVYP
jgi:hypothetical protein